MWPQMSPEACVFSSGRKVGQKLGCDGASAKMPSGALALTWRPWHEFVTQGSTYLLVSKDRRLPANCPPFAFVPLLRSRNDCSAAQRWQSAEVARERESMCRCGKSEGLREGEQFTPEQVSAWSVEEGRWRGTLKMMEDTHASDVEC